jgi:hypothetical protein
VSRVTVMTSMFHGASVFHQYIGSWDVSRVTSMHTMFWRALAFNQDGRCWNIAEVVRKTSMLGENSIQEVGFLPYAWRAMIAKVFFLIMMSRSNILMNKGSYVLG